MKKFDIKDVYSWFNREDARKYINKKGYFASNINQFEILINKEDPTIFLAIHEDNGSCFGTTHYPVGGFGYCFFLPVDKVKEVTEKKYRPFKSIDEFKKTLNTDFGQSVQIRDKDDHNQNWFGVFNGYSEKDNKLKSISIGSWWWQPEHSFEFYEVFNEQTEEWQPFGVKEC